MSGYITRLAIPVWYAELENHFHLQVGCSLCMDTLYVLMGIAAGGIWAKGMHHRWVKTALYHFAAQLIFNALWTLTFFGLKRPELALLIIVILAILIERCIYWFAIVQRTMSLLLYPYLAWVVFATFLNLGIVSLNR